MSCFFDFSLALPCGLKGFAGFGLALMGMGFPGWRDLCATLWLEKK
jgi:hypothetical protein